MSTKTSFKRIALVAVAALGAGVLSVAPASAGGGDYTASIDTTNTTNTGALAAPIPSGTAWVGTIGMSLQAATLAATDQVSLIATVTAGPAALDITSTCTFTAKTVAGLALSIKNATTGELEIDSTGTNAAVAAHTAYFDFSCPTTIGGTYNMQLSEGALTTKSGFATGTFNTPTADTPDSGRVVVSGLNVSQGTTRSTTAGTAQNGGNANVIWTLPTRAAATDVFQVIPSGVGTVQTVASAANATVTPISGVSGNFTSGARVVSAANDTTTLTSVNITATSTVAGVLTLTTQSISSTTGVVTTIGTATVTFGAAPVISATTSTEFLSAGQDCATSDDAGGVTLASTAGVALGAGNETGATICITVLDQNAVAINGQPLSVTIAGPGLITLTSGNGNGATGTVRAASLTATNQASTNQARIGISADGTSGVGTITISSGTTVLATKTVTFYGAVATLTAKQNHKIASSAGAALGVGTAAPTSADIANTPAVVITAKDANGVNVPGLTITALSSDTTVMSNTITVAGVTAAPGTYNVAVNSVANTSGKTATLTFRVMSGTTVLAATAPVSYTLGGAVASVALSLNKASYSVGEAATATLTLKDAAGNAAFDADHANILTAALASSLSVVKALQFNTTATSASSLGGVATVTFNAPGTSGTNWTISGTTGTGPSAAAEKGKALTATAAVTSGSDVAALTTLINSLIAKINALSKLVTKIQKKVRA